MNQTPTAAMPSASTRRMIATRPGRSHQRRKPAAPSTSVVMSSAARVSMTGTAETEAAEFMNTYELGVVAIETNRPMVREDREDLVYKNEVVKFAAVVQDIEQRHEKIGRAHV